MPLRYALWQVGELRDGWGNEGEGGEEKVPFINKTVN